MTTKITHDSQTPCHRFKSHFIKSVGPCVILHPCNDNLMNIKLNKRIFSDTRMKETLGNFYVGFISVSTSPRALCLDIGPLINSLKIDFQQL